MRYNKSKEKQPAAAKPGADGSGLFLPEKGGKPAARSRTRPATPDADQPRPRQEGTVMDFWKNAAHSVTKAVDFIVDKNRRAAMMNRLKIVIRSEKEAQNYAFAQLGKYYYQNVRDTENGDTEPYCAAIDTAGARLKRAYAKLDELAVPTADAHDTQPPECSCDECGCEDCGDDMEGDDFAGEPVDDGTGFRPDEGFRPDVAHQEAADEEEDYLHPFSVVPNDKPEEGEPDENSADDTDEEKK